MRSDECSPDARRAATPGPGVPARHRWGRLLGGITAILGRADAVRISIHILMSLAAALAGSIAAIVLVPLIQPGQAPTFGGRELVLPARRETLVLMLLVSIGVYALLRWLVSKLAARVIGDCTVRLRILAHARLTGADLAAVTGSTSAEIANVLTANVNLITQGVGAFLQLLVASLTTVVSLVFAFWVSPALTMILPALAGLGLIASRWQGREQSRVSREYVRDMTRLFWLSEDFPRRLRHIRSFEREEAEEAGYRAVATGLGDGYRRQIELAASGKLLMELLAAICMAGIFMLAGRWQGTDQASLIAVGLLLGRLLPYLASTRYNIQQLHLAAPALGLWQRYATLDAAQPETAPAGEAAAAQRIHIESMGVALSSLRVDIQSLSLVPGEMTLITGDSGAGKSTLADVLAGMTAPATFAARSGGRSVGFDVYRQLVRRGAYVSQHVRPWQCTVRECLLWVAPDASDECLRGVLADVGLGKRLGGMQDGLEVELQGSSCCLSGGELQRLLLAQVILRQPSLAVLDEATGALDAASEMRVLAALKQRLPRTVLIVVAHRHGPAGIAEQCLHIAAGGIATVTRQAPAGAVNRVASRLDVEP
jgi:ATP-binding cassette subfamily C protein